VAKRMAVASSGEPVYRVVVTSADASQDYFMKRSKIVELNLSMVQVYNNEIAYFDPDNKYRKFAEHPRWE